MASYNKLAVDSPIKKAVAVTLVILFSVDTTAALCKTNSYAVNVKGEIQCQKCRKCPPGSYVSRVCGDYDDTECAQCDDGSYSTGWSRLGECKPCTLCPAHLATTRNCTTTQNAKCGKVCDHGYYSNILTAECEPCSWCLSTDENILQTRVPECVAQNMPRRFQCRQDKLLKDVPTYTDLSSNISSYGDKDFVDSELPKLSHYHFSVPSVVLSVIVICLITVVFAIISARRCKQYNNSKKGYASIDDVTTSDYFAATEDVNINIRVNPFDASRMPEDVSPTDYTIWDASNHVPGAYAKDTDKCVEINSSISN